MAALPYMNLYVSDYLADTAHLTAAEHGAYLLLIMTYWQRGEGLPADDGRLARIARMTPGEWATVRDTLAEFFTEQDGLWTHSRVERELQAVREKSDKARRAGEASAARRLVNVRSTDAAEEINGRSTDVQRTLNACSTDAERTCNHTDTDTDTEKKERGVDARASADDPQSEIDKKQKPKRIDPDWQPSPALRSEAQSLGLTPDQIDRAASRFRAHHLGSGAKRADWGPLFVSWCADDAAKWRAGKPQPATTTPAEAVWIVEGSEAWATVTKARGRPPVKTYRAGDAGAWLRPDEIPKQAGAA